MPNITYCTDLNKKISAQEAEKRPDPYAMSYTCPHCGAQMHYNRRSVSGKKPYFSGSHSPNCLYSRLKEIPDAEAEYLSKNLDLRFYLEPTKNHSSGCSGSAKSKGAPVGPHRTLEKDYSFLKSNPPDAIVGAQRKRVRELLHDARAEEYGGLNPQLMPIVMIELTSTDPTGRESQTLVLKLYDSTTDNDTKYILDFRPAPSLPGACPMPIEYQKKQKEKADKLYESKSTRFFNLKTKYGAKKRVVVVCSGQWRFDSKKNAWITHVHSPKQVCIF